jgi:hypothetical protein
MMILRLQKLIQDEENASHVRPKVKQYAGQSHNLQQFILFTNIIPLIWSLALTRTGFFGEAWMNFPLMIVLRE